MLRYYFDEHVDPDIATALRLRSIDALTALEAGLALKRIPDAEQLAFATSQGRVLVTKEKREFPDLAGKQLPHAGIIILQRKASMGSYIEFLEYAAKVLEPEYMQNRLEYYDW